MPTPTPSVLHLVDLRNLALHRASAGEDLRSAVEGALRGYWSSAARGPVDQAVVATSGTLAEHAALSSPGGRLVIGHGVDGPRQALIAWADVDWVARRFSAVFLGSGDSRFAPLVASLADRGVPTAVFTPSRRALARTLRTVASSVTVLPQPTVVRACRTVSRRGEEAAHARAA